QPRRLPGPRPAVRLLRRVRGPVEETMGNLPITLATRDFGVLPRVLQDPAIHGGEASFSRHVQRLAAGDISFVALPAFVMREFRHRNFFVRLDAGLREMRELAGTRIGMDAWPNRGNTS